MRNKIFGQSKGNGKIRQDQKTLNIGFCVSFESHCQNVMSGIETGH